MKDSLACLLLAGCLAIVGALPAQDRQPLFGSVVRAGGTPLAGAAVTLVESDADMVGLDALDVVKVTTDGRGRFVASALRGVRYAAFAVGPEVDGAALVARPVGDLACGRHVELRAVTIGSSRPLQLKGLAAWGELQDLRVRLRFDHCPGYFVDLPIAKDGTVDVPPSGVVATADLYDKNGGRMAGVYLPSRGEKESEVTDCAWLDVQVVDDDGKPVEGAEVTVQYEDRGEDFMTVATYSNPQGDSAVTKADGTARLRCRAWQHPIETHPDTFVVVARKKGFLEGGSGWLCKESFEGWNMKVRKGKKLRIPMQAIKPGRAIVPPKKELTSKAFAGRRVRLFAMANAVRTQGAQVMSYFYSRSYELNFGADGQWQVPSLAPTTTDLILQLPPVDGRRVMMLPTSAPQLPSADLSTCELLSLQLLDVSGGPASDASVLLVPRHIGALGFRHLSPLVPDQAGRVEVLLQRGEWTLLAMDDTSWVSAALTDWSADQPLRLQLANKPSRRVRVLDSSGKPVAGATFEPGSFRSGFPTAPGLDSVLSQLGWNTFGNHIRRAKTDADGEATLYFLPWPNTQPTAFTYLRSFKTRSEDTAILEGEEVLELHLK